LETIEKGNNSLKKNALVISNDFELILDLKSNFKKDEYLYNITYVNKDDFLSNKYTEHVDVMVFDNVSDDLKLLTMNLIKFENTNLNTPIIIIENKLNVNLSDYNFINAYTIIYKPINVKFIFTAIGLCINYIYLNNKITFEAGFYFDINKKLLFKDKKMIDLTKMETKIIVLLSKNINGLVTYEEIAENIWKKKNYSIFSLRNIVKNIRTKTYDSFIKNKSNRGYVINSL
jgi:DNA-binding response OmpR family regulator